MTTEKRPRPFYPTLGQRIDAIKRDFTQLADAMWQMSAYDSPEDIGAEIKEHMGDWLAGFDMSCKCRTPGILCECPIRPYNDGP